MRSPAVCGAANPGRRHTDDRRVLAVQRGLPLGLYLVPAVRDQLLDPRLDRLGLRVRVQHVLRVGGVRSGLADRDEVGDLLVVLGGQRGGGTLPDDRRAGLGPPLDDLAVVVRDDLRALGGRLAVQR